MINRLRAWVYEAKNKQTVFWIAIGGSAFLSGVLSLWIGMRQSVWFDEAYSVIVAKQSVGEILRLTALDTHPPLSYLLLHGWASVFGWSEFALRLMSSLALIAIIVMAGVLVRRLFGTRVAVGTVLLLAISPMLIRYGFEIRMYSIGVLIGVAATYALVRAQEKGAHQRRWLVLYAVLVALGMYTMYSLALLWIAHVSWLLYRHVSRSRPLKELQTWAVTYVGSVVLFLPWLPSFISQLGNGALAPIGQPLNLENLTEIATFNVLYRALHEVNALSTMLSIGLCVIIGYALIYAFKRSTASRDKLLLLTFSFSVPVASIMLVSIVSAVYVERYLLFAGIYGMMLVGVTAMLLLRARPGVKTKLLVGLVYVGCLVGCVQLFVMGNYNYQRMQTPTVEQVVQSVQCRADQRVIAADPYVAIELDYYLSDCPVYFISEYDELKGGYAPLSGSERQIKNIEQLRGESFTYVYYGEGDEQLWRLCSPQERRLFESLTVASVRCD